MVYYFRAIEKIAYSLKGKPKHSWIAPVALSLLILVTLFGFGVYLDGYVIHPPVKYQGVCPSPAIIKGTSCIQIETATIVSGSNTITKTQTVQAGTVIGLLGANSTKGK